MELNFNVKVRAGTRTSVEVEARCTAVNEKMIKFIGGRTLTSGQIAEWIRVKLQAELNEVQGGTYHE